MSEETKKRGRPPKAPQTAQNALSATETSVAVKDTPKQELVLEGDPMAQLEFAKKAADALMSVVSRKKNPVIIGGKTYLEYGDGRIINLVRFVKPATEIYDRIYMLE